ncbi:MAG: hypothetical protein ACRD8A_13865 [Candidatus Acidiferrales bacterium]
MKRYAILLVSFLFCVPAFASNPLAPIILVATMSQSRSGEQVKISWGNPDPKCSATSSPCTISYRIWRGSCEGCEQGLSTGVPFGDTRSLSWIDSRVSEAKATTLYYTVDAVETNGTKTVYSNESREVSVALQRAGTSMGWVVLLTVGIGGAVLLAWAVVRGIAVKK